MKWEAAALLCDYVASFAISVRYRWFQRAKAIEILRRPPKVGSFIVSTLLTTVFPIVLILRLGA